ncbi:MAG: DUF3500 domain-containing protein [Hyphomicrobiaceae bacterium]
MSGARPSAAPLTQEAIAMPCPLDRRDVLAGLGAALTVPLLPTGAVAAAPLAPLADADALTRRVLAFREMLDPAQRRRAAFPWNGEQWRSWNYFGIGGYTKPGLRLEQMKPAEKDAAWGMFAEVLSPEGLDKARTVMALQDVLVEMGNGRGARSSERFSISIFGEPGPAGAWGLRLEGHHLSLSFAVVGGKLVSVTPAAFAALPNRVLSGRRKGLVALKGEETLARRLQRDLAPKLKARAQAGDEHLFNILSYAGEERANTRKTGVVAADMTEGQRELLWQLVETYAVAPYTGALAQAQRRRLRAGDPAAVHFAWYGPNRSERSFGYRITADAFVVELGCVDGKAQHLHPVFHDLGNTLGRPA